MQREKVLPDLDCWELKHLKFVPPLKYQFLVGRQILSASRRPSTKTKQRKAKCLKVDGTFDARTSAIKLVARSVFVEVWV
jgi:hypothetical protein